MIGDRDEEEDWVDGRHSEVDEEPEPELEQEPEAEPEADALDASFDLPHRRMDDAPEPMET